MIETHGAPILSVSGLRVAFVDREGRETEAVSGIDLEVGRGRILGIVGESGSGKTTTALAIAGLLASNGLISGGTVTFDDVEMRGGDISRVRGERVGYVFQDPVAHLDPVFRIGSVFAELYRMDARSHGRKRPGRRECDVRAAEALASVGITDAPRVLRSYPHEVSGGMAQRVVIALALVRGPELLFADEPTTALDVTVQAQVLDLLLDIRDRTGVAMVIITHNIGVVATICDDVAVMKDGVIVESGSTTEILTRPTHPYTISLLRAQPAQLVLEEELA